MFLIESRYLPAAFVLLNLRLFPMDSYPSHKAMKLLFSPSRCSFHDTVEVLSLWAVQRKRAVADLSHIKYTAAFSRGIQEQKSVTC